MEIGPECYGRMFPSVLPVVPNRDVRAAVFGYRVEHSGLADIGHEVTADTEAWDRCRRCPRLDGCYRLSSGRLLLEMAIRG